VRGERVDQRTLDGVKQGRDVGAQEVVAGAGQRYLEAAAVTGRHLTADQLSALEAVHDPGDAAVGQGHLGGQVAHAQPTAGGTGQAYQRIEVGAGQPVRGVHGAQLGDHPGVRLDEQAGEGQPRVVELRTGPGHRQIIADF